MGWLLLGLLVAGCETRPSLRHAHHRLVDLAASSAFDTDFGTGWRPATLPAPAPPATSHLTVGGIANDSRFVLAAPPFSLLYSSGSLEGPADGKLHAVRPVPGPLLDATSILALPSVRIGGVWTDLDPLLLRPVRSQGGASLELDLVLPEAARGQQKVVVNVFAYGLTWGRRTRFTSPAVQVPPAATLEFALGLRNPGRDATATTCTVQACVESVCRPLFEEKLTPAAADADVPWREVQVDLAELAGQEPRFEFACLYDDGEELPTSFPLWGHPTIYAPRPLAKGSRASNVVLISLDTLAARHLDLHGYPHETAPKMKARFGSRGVVFEQCMAAATATAPSHMTMFTSMDPLQHGMTDGMSGATTSATRLAESIRGAGITTAAFTENGWLSIAHGFGLGFDRFVEDRSPDMMAPVGRIENTFGRAKAWLEENRDKPFFLFLHTFEVHDPHHPPEAYQDLFVAPGQDPRDPAVPRAIRDRVAYDQEIRYTDDQLELLMQKIDELGLAESTLVIVLSDHGEAFGEHGYVVHGNFMYEEVLHVMLMMQGPGVRPGTRVRDVVGHVDIMPTVLDAFGLPSPHGHLRGKSLQPYMADGTPSRRENQHRAMFAESWGGFALTTERQLVKFFPPALAARLGPRKIVRYREEAGYRYEAYDLADDPEEKNDLFKTGPERFADLRKLVDNYEAYSRRTRDSLESGAPADSGSDQVILSPDQEEKLRALGYIQ